MANNESVQDRLMKLVSETKQTKDSSGGFNVEKAISDLQPLIEKQIELEVAKAMENQATPVEEGYDFNGVDISKSRYSSMAKTIAKDGKFRYGNEFVTFKDITFANHLLELLGKDKPSSDMKGLLKSLTPMSGIAKFLNTGTAGQGLEWTPDDTRALLWEDFYQFGNVLALLPAGNIEMDVPNGTRYPARFSDDKWIKFGEGVEINAQTPETARPTINYTQLGIREEWADRIDEDSVFDIAIALRRSIVNSARRKMNAFCLNADATSAATGNINSDDAAPPSNAYYLSDGDDGMIKQWLVDNTAQAVDNGGAALVIASLKSAFAKIDKYFVSESVGIITNTSGWLSMMHLANVITVANDMRTDAMVVTGALSNYLGKPIVINPDHGLAEADGKLSATAINNTLGRISVITGEMWRAGGKNLRMTGYETPGSFKQGIAARFEIGVTAFGTRSTNTHTSGVYNFTI